MLLVRAAKDECCAWKPLPLRHSGALTFVGTSQHGGRRSRSGPVETSFKR
jgi:hypothetical protein